MKRPLWQLVLAFLALVLIIHFVFYGIYKFEIKKKMDAEIKRLESEINSAGTRLSSDRLRTLHQTLNYLRNRK